MFDSGRLNLVDAIWSLDGSEASWLERLAVAFAGALPTSSGATVFAGTLREHRFGVHTVGSVASGEALTSIVTAIRAAPAEAIERVVRVSPDGLVAFRTGLHHGSPSHVEFGDALARHTALDTMNVGTVLPDGACIIMTAGQPRVLHLRRGEQRAWLRVAAHLAAAERLRRAARTRPLHDFDVILDERGAVCDADAAALASDSTRDLLRHAVMTSESAQRLRRLGRGDDALALLPALWDGNWSVIDVWDTDGRRYYAAAQNPPEGAAVRALSHREQQVVHAATSDAALKVIAADLGLSESAVSRHLTTALRKLGLPTRTDLIRASVAHRRLLRLGDAGVAMRPTTDPGTTPLQVLTSDLAGDWAQPLTTAETRVASLMLQGLEDAAIAQSLGVSQRTVANQCAAIFHKLGIGSRIQLAALAATSRSA